MFRGRLVSAANIEDGNQFLVLLFIFFQVADALFLLILLLHFLQHLIRVWFAVLCVVFGSALGENKPDGRLVISKRILTPILVETKEMTVHYEMFNLGSRYVL